MSKRQSKDHEGIFHNFELKSLQREHEILEKKIDAILGKKYLTEEEERLKKILQKKKLAGRDRMEQILRQCQSA